MSWFPERHGSSWLRRFCTRILQEGPIPKHVAIIMDGNRRFAVKNSMARAEGHMKGFDKLTETLEWCLDIGINEVTVYAFSIENFKRSKEEVECLMELSRKKFARLMEEKDLLVKHDVCVRVLGDLTLLPYDIQQTIAEAVLFTQNHRRATLNVCFAYTSRDEMCAAMREVVDGVQLGLIKESDITEDLLDKCMYTSPSVSPDLLIRTSGEVRLSDFLLWQSAFSVLSFIKVLWPDFSFWHLCGAILHYQRNYEQVKAFEDKNKLKNRLQEREMDYQCVKEELESKSSPAEAVDSNTIQIKIDEYAKLREIRVATFLKHVKNKRAKALESLIIHTKNYSKATEPAG